MYRLFPETCHALKLKDQGEKVIGNRQNRSLLNYAFRKDAQEGSYIGPPGFGGG